MLILIDQAAAMLHFLTIKGNISSVHNLQEPIRIGRSEANDHICAADCVM